MGTQAVSPYQQVIEKTKNLAFRSQMLVMNIEKKLATKDQEVIYCLVLFFCLIVVNPSLFESRDLQVSLC